MGAARIVGQIPVVADGKVHVAEFGGKGYLHVDHHPLLNCPAGLTLEAWIAPGKRGPTTGRLIDKTPVGQAGGGTIGGARVGEPQIAA